MPIEKHELAGVSSSTGNRGGRSAASSQRLRAGTMGGFGHPPPARPGMRENANLPIGDGLATDYRPNLCGTHARSSPKIRPLRSFSAAASRCRSN